TKGNPFTVSLDRPLAAGQVAYAATFLDSSPLSVYSWREVNVSSCPPAPVLSPAPNPPAVTSGLTDAQSLQGVKTALAKSGAQLRAIKLKKLAKLKSVALRFAFPEAGTARMQLSAKQGKKTKVLGAGSQSSGGAGTANVTLKLTSAGRALLKR